MHQEATTENNYREYNIFNKQSGQSYVVSYDVNHNEDSCTIKVSRKHISTENGHTLKDFSTITEINVREYSQYLTTVGLIAFKLPNKKEIKRDLVKNTKKVATTFALALEKNDIACLGIISEFNNASIRMKDEAMCTLDDIIAEKEPSYEEKSAMHKEIKKAWEYVDLTIKNRGNSHE